MAVIARHGRHRAGSKKPVTRPPRCCPWIPFDDGDVGADGDDVRLRHTPARLDSSSGERVQSAKFGWKENGRCHGHTCSKNVEHSLLAGVGTHARPGPHTRT